MAPEKHCDICGRSIAKRQVSFVLRIELLADPTPADITDEDLEKDCKKEMEKLLAAMEDIDPEEAQDEVYERYAYCICMGCRKGLHHRLKFPFLSMD